MPKTKALDMILWITRYLFTYITTPHKEISIVFVDGPVYLVEGSPGNDSLGPPWV